MHKIAVIGCGYWGPNLLRNFHANPNCEITTVCDLDKKRLFEIGKQYPSIATSSDFNDVIESEEIQAVAIATPVFTHYDLARKCLLAGKHVLVEKPMALSTAECHDLVRTAQQKGLTLMVGHTFVYSPVVRKIKSIIDAGDLGEIQYISSRRLNLGLFQKDINVAWDLAPHDISIILYLLGEKPVSVNCQGKDHIKAGIEDVTNMTLDFSGNCFATVQSSWLDPNKVREMIIVGTQKMLVYDDIEPLEKIKIYDKRVVNPPHYTSFGEFQYSYHYGDIHIPFVKQCETLGLECQHFIECIRESRKPDSSGLEGMDVVRILEASSKSLKNNGSRIYINYNDFLVEEECIVNF